MKYDPASHGLSGLWCLSCGKQEFRRSQRTCRHCGAPLQRLHFGKGKSRRNYPPASQFGPANMERASPVAT
jgi:predicted amidophosphoribosyltransferase